VQFFLKPESGPGLLFSILNEQGYPAYEAAGEFTPLGCRCTLRTPGGISVARMTGVCLPNSFRCSVVQGKRKIQVYLHLGASSRAPVRFRGVRWRFRGSLVTRSFDVVEELPHSHARVVMTHGRCWNGSGDCYAVTVARAEDVPLALCVAVAVDSSAQNGCLQPVPAG